MSMTRLVLKRPVSALLALLALLVFGAYSASSLRLELMPDMDMPIMMVMTVYPGADPESIDDLVTSEIEGDVSSLSGVDSVMSYSQENVSIVVIQYDYDQNTNDAYLDLRAALDITATDFPDDCQEPMIIEMDINSTPSIMYSVSMTDGSDVLSYVNSDVIPEIEALSSVASVEASGGDENYVRVLLNEEALNQYGLSMSSVAQYIGTTDFTIPLGSVDQGSQTISVNSTSENDTIQALQRIPLFTSSGNLIQLSDVADVSWSVKDADSVSRFNGEDTVTLSVTKNQSASTIGMVNDVRNVIDTLQEENPALEAEASYDASELILESISSVASTLVMGVILSMLILFIFFGDFKASLIVGSAMPISLIATVIVMAIMGFSINILSMGGLVIAIGMMVDNSIVTIESCFRSSDRIPDFKEAALQGAKGVLGSITAGTITTVVIYLPICLLTTGLIKQIFGQLGWTIIFSLLASLISAMTLVPLFYMLFKPKEKKELKINGFLDKVRDGYDKLIRKLLHRKKRCVLVVVLLLIGAFGLASTLDSELMPTVDQGMINISATFRSGTNVETVSEEMQQIEDIVMAHEDVENYTLTAEAGSASISVNLKDDRKMTSQEVADQWTQETAGINDIQLEITVGSQMSSMMSSATGGEVNLEATDLDELMEATEQIKEAAWQVPGVLDVYTTSGETSTQLKVVIDPFDAMSHGMTPIQVAGSLYSMISGTEAMTITSDGDEYSVYLEFPKGTYDDASTLMDANVNGVTLSEIAHLEYTNSQQSIVKTDEKYTDTITAVCLSDDVDAVQDALDEIVADMTLPDSVELTQSAMDEQMGDAFSTMGLAIAAALFLVFLVMAMQFESPKYSLMVMISIPFSLIGSFLLMFLTGTAISVTSLMGVLTLVGTVVNNGILYVDGVNELRMRMPLEDALVRSGQTRLRPMLMTTLTTIISMIPMALGRGTGNAMMQGMAIVIIGGLCASTVLILIFFPEFYLIVYGRSKGERRERRKRFFRKGRSEELTSVGEGALDE